MANTIKLKRSAVPGKVPTTGDLALGELGLNTYDGKLYAKKDDGTASIFQIGGLGLGASLIDTTTAGTIYVGSASLGADQSANVWKVTRSTYSASGSRTDKGTATNVSWTGRSGHSYT